ncbi:RusA family crossover junction endodeoxyribonuclease [Candidatus Arsenophonus triatominarum]|uniref:RusA family crossover junction endodeoxyribonuclease n=1 Tax=Candidatus Arsenophonus triatominarum TaxID=57911 RepID=UPI0009419FAB|nr:RusA family crossover junction endodeoxyribonuclease [Candidatus Arsenophonus triatominarum]
MKTYNITVPFPPSVNHYWYHAKHKHFITTKGKLYRQSVVAEIMRQKLCKRLPQRLGVEIGVYPPDRRKRDLDIARRLNFDYSICIKNRSSIVHPVSIFLRLA